MDYKTLIRSTAEQTVNRIINNAVNPKKTVSGSYNRKPDINSKKSHAIIHMGGHGSDTNVLLEEALFEDYEYIKDRILFFSLAQKNDVVRAYCPLINFNDLEKSNKDKIKFYNEENKASTKLNHSGFKIVDNLRTELIENDKLVSNVMEDLQEICIDGFTPTAKHYSEIPHDLQDDDESKFYNSVCSGNFAKPVIFKYDRIYQYDTEFDHIQFLDIRDPKTEEQANLMTNDNFMKKPLFFNKFNKLFEIELSYLLFELFLGYRFDYVTIFDFGCRCLENHKISEHDIQDIIREENELGKNRLDDFKRLTLGGYGKRHKQKIRKHSKKHRKKTPRKTPRKTTKNTTNKTTKK